MKLVITNYLRSLRERDELDAILPDLLAESGFEIITHPRRGTRQAGVDVAAIGPNLDRNNERSLFLFTIKSGDLSRKNWDTGQQAVRPSINEILDDYIPNRIPPHQADLPIVICVCIGGEMHEDIRAQWKGFCENATNANIHFAEWNGNHLADMILNKMLRAELIESKNKGLLEKALAMLDQPDTAYQYFSHLLNAIFAEPKKEAERIHQLRKAHLCLWILFVWARDVNNLEAAYRASELLLLRSWPYCDSPYLEKSIQEEIFHQFSQIIYLYTIIADLFLVKKIGSFINKPYALSIAVNSKNHADINITLFEILGRLTLFGIWLDSFNTISDQTFTQTASEKSGQVLDMAIQMINENPTLNLPVRDDFAIEVALLIFLANKRGRLKNIANYIRYMSDLLCQGLIHRTCYPTSKTNYRDVLAHPKNNSDVYFEEHTKAGILYTLILIQLAIIGDQERIEKLRNALLKCAPYMTHQIWIPNLRTNEIFWNGDINHGHALIIKLNQSLENIFNLLNQTIESYPLDEQVSACKICMPIFLTACRHYRMPIPPHLWKNYNETTIDNPTSN